MADHFAEKLDTDIGDDLAAHPLHAVGAPVGAKGAHSHDRGDSQTNQNDRIDLWPGIVLEHLKI